jgi:hypothetical protein
MGIRFNCPSGHKLNVKEFLAGKRGVCPQCGAKCVSPTPAEAQAAESPLSVGNGLTQSIEIAVAPAPERQAVTASASPSVIIPVVDAEIELAAPELELPPTVTGPQFPVADVLPASIVGVVSPTVAAPVQVPPVAAVPSQRERSRRNQVVVSLLLLGLVVVLAGVLIWVLKREMNQTPVEKKETAVSEGEFRHALVVTGFDSITNSHSHAGVDL